MKIDLRIPGEAPNPYHLSQGEPRAVLVGHSPSPSAPNKVLIESRTEVRLRELLGCGTADYLTFYDRVNLLPLSTSTTPSATYAKRMADQITVTALRRCRTLILLGREVCDTFMGHLGMIIRDMDGEKIEVFAPRLTIVPVPHPSPRSLVWNDPRVFGRLREALRLSL